MKMFLGTKTILRRGLYVCITLFYAVLTFIMTLHIYDFGAYTDFQRHAAWVQELWVDGSFFDFVKTVPYCGWHTLMRCALCLDMPINVAVASVTALFNACTAAICLYYLNRTFNSRLHPMVIAVIGLTILMVSAIWLPCFNQEIYKGQGSPNIWHSPTYDAVRPVSVLTVIFFLDSIKNRSTSLSLNRIIALSFLILLGIVLKPSFFAVLLPSIIMYAVIDYFWNGDIRFDFKMLSPLLAPIAISFVVFIQLFTSNASSASGNSSIALVFFQNLLSPNPIVSDLLLLAFPLYAIVICRKEIFCKGSPYVLIVLMLFVGFCEYSFVAETGIRATDGNFAWGLMSAVFIAWLYLLPLFIKTAASGGISRASQVVGFVLVAGHLFSGICYFCYLLFISTSQC